MISRSHGEMVVFQGNTYYRDLESSNGTYINDQLYGVDSRDGKMQKRLVHGDVIRIGKYALLFVTEYPQEFQWRVLPLSDNVEAVNIGRADMGSGTQQTY